MVVTILTITLVVLGYIAVRQWLEINDLQLKVTHLNNVAQNLSKLYHQAVENQCQCPKEN